MASLSFLLLFVFLLLSPSTANEILINVKPGATVILPCHLQSNKPVIVTEWTRPDLVPEYVLFYRDGQSDPENQCESFKDRVQLRDRQMTNGDVSMVLQNVMLNDTGTYECHIWRRASSRKRSTFNTEPISTVRLTVEPGHTTSTAWVAGVAVAAVAVIVGVVGVVGFVMLRKRRISQQKPSIVHGLELPLMPLSL